MIETMTAKEICDLPLEKVECINSQETFNSMYTKFESEYRSRMEESTHERCKSSWSEEYLKDFILDNMEYAPHMVLKFYIDNCLNPGVVESLLFDLAHNLDTAEYIRFTIGTILIMIHDTIANMDSDSITNWLSVADNWFMCFENSLNDAIFDPNIYPYFISLSKMIIPFSNQVIIKYIEELEIDARDAYRDVIED